MSRHYGAANAAAFLGARSRADAELENLVHLDGKERLIFSLLNARRDNFVGEGQIVAFAYGLFDPPPDRQQLANQMRRIRDRCAMVLGTDPIQHDPVRGYKISSCLAREAFARPRPQA